jgi:hypothetical protein
MHPICASTSLYDIDVVTTTKDEEELPKDLKPWHKLHGMAELLAPPEEGVLKDDDFEALRVNDRTSRADAAGIRRQRLRRAQHRSVDEPSD